MSHLLATIQGRAIYQDEDDSFSFLAGMTIDADGSPRAYGPHNSGLDRTIEAGHPGNWWGIVTDSNGEPVIQGEDDPYPGFYVSATSLQHRSFKKNDPRRYLNSELVPYVVCPGILAKKALGVVLGCKVDVLNVSNGVLHSGVCGDIGPSTHLGEASIKMAALHGIPSSPRTGGISKSIFKYTFHPGHAAQGYSLQPLGT